MRVLPRAARLRCETGCGSGACTEQPTCRYCSRRLRFTISPAAASSTTSQHSRRLAVYEGVRNSSVRATAGNRAITVGCGGGEVEATGSPFPDGCPARWRARPRASAIFYGALPFTSARTCSCARRRYWKRLRRGGDRHCGRLKHWRYSAYLAGSVQTDIKRALSFASLTQVGIIVAEIGFGAWEPFLWYVALGSLARSRLLCGRCCNSCDAITTARLPAPGGMRRREIESRYGVLEMPRDAGKVPRLALPVRARARLPLTR